MNIALSRFQCLVSIWSVECLQALEMSQHTSESEYEEEENESDLNN